MFIFSAKFYKRSLLEKLSNKSTVSYVCSNNHVYFTKHHKIQKSLSKVYDDNISCMYVIFDRVIYSRQLPAILYTIRDKGCREALSNLSTTYVVIRVRCLQYCTLSETRYEKGVCNTVLYSRQGGKRGSLSNFPTSDMREKDGLVQYN
jgi:hypothetical protein